MNAARRAREELVNSGKLRLFTGRERGRYKPLLGRRSTTNGMQGVRHRIVVTTSTSPFRGTTGTPHAHDTECTEGAAYGVLVARQA
eukprot:scaffold40081_cov81-Phaeocystis_antarctica.AAC.1